MLFSTLKNYTRPLTFYFLLWKITPGLCDLIIYIEKLHAVFDNSLSTLKITPDLWNFIIYMENIARSLTFYYQHWEITHKLWHYIIYIGKSHMGFDI